MRIVVRRTRDDSGWKAVIDGHFTGIQEDNVFRTVLEAAVAAHVDYPTAKVFLDDREHTILSNGVSMIRGEQDLKEITYEERP